MRFLSAFAALLLLLCMSTNAFAHAALVSTEPRDGSMVAQAPQRIELRFNEAVAHALVRLIAAEGRVRDDAAVQEADETISSTRPESLPSGAQVVSSRVMLMVSSAA